VVGVVCWCAEELVVGIRSVFFLGPPPPFDRKDFLCYYGFEF